MCKNKFYILILAVIISTIIATCAVACDDETTNSNQGKETTRTEYKYGQIQVETEQKSETFLLNVKSKKIHKITCGTGDLMLPENRMAYEGDIEDLYDQGYSKCGNCFRSD